METGSFEPDLFQSNFWFWGLDTDQGQNSKMLESLAIQLYTLNCKTLYSCNLWRQLRLKPIYVCLFCLFHYIHGKSVNLPLRIDTWCNIYLSCMTPFALSLCLLIRVIMLRNNISASLLQFFNRFLNRIMFWCDILVRVKVGTDTGKVWSSLWTRKLDSSEAPARLRRFIGDTNFESIELRKAQKRSKFFK